MLLFASLLGTALAIWRLGRIDGALALLTALSGHIVLLFLFGLAGQLQLGSSLLLIAGLALLPIVGLFVAGNWQVRPNWSASLVYGVIAVCFGLFVAKWYGQFEFLSWDEFSHWALASRDMVNTDALPTASSPLLYKAYPPGMALLQYHFSRWLGYSESAILVAHVCFFGACLSAAIAPVRSRPGIAIATALVLAAVTFGLGFTLYEVTVDHIIGATLGAILVAAVARRNLNARTITALAPAFAALALTKHVGIAFAAVGIGALIVEYLFCLLARDLSRAEQLRKLFAVGACVLAVAAMWILWKGYYNSIGVTDSYGSVASLSNIFAFFLSPSEGKQVAIWQEFGTRVSSSYFLWVLACILVHAVFVAASCRGDRAKQALLFLICAGGLLSYVALLLVSYAYYFPDYEAVRLASFERFVGSYLIAWFFAATVGLASVATIRLPRLRYDYLAVAAAVVFFAVMPSARNMAIAPASSRFINFDWRDEMRTLTKQMAYTLREEGVDTDKVFFIDQNSAGYTQIMFRYDALPLTTNMKCWSLGPKYNNDDVYTCDIALDEALEEYQYLALVNADAQFWANNAQWFDEPDRNVTSGLFRAERSPELHLVRLF